MKVIHLGSRPLARRCLHLMDEEPGISVEAVVARPPDHDGWWEGSLASLAAELNYPVITEAEITDYSADFLISTLYWNVLDEEVLEHPTYGGLNLHQAELPRFRGCNSFSHAILKAREDDHWRYGTTLHFMAPAVDEGDIVDRRFLDIEPTDTARTLYDRVEDLSVELFADHVPNIADGSIISRRTPQSAFDGPVYYHARDSLADLKEISRETFVDPDDPLALYDRVRALEFPPFTPAYTGVGDRRLYLTTTPYGSGKQHDVPSARATQE